jgi:hypothetical protein
LLWAGTVIFVVMLNFIGSTASQNRYARAEWIGFLVCSTGQFALFILERRRKFSKIDQ